MDKHKPSDEMIKDLDNLLSKLNGMEIVASDDYQKNSIKVMRALVEGQMHSINEFRIMSVLGVTTFWISVAVILGALWHKTRPDAEISTR